MTPNGGFVYQSLPKDGESIRLLKILPNCGSSGLVQCELKHATIHDAYTALSYTWGSPIHELEVEVNGKTLLVRRNLWAFLRRVSVSPKYVVQTFWIDAICINQEDDREKSSQVAQMGKTYESACHVLIWLAPEDIHQDISLNNPALPISHFGDMTHCLFQQADRYIRGLITKHDYWRRLWIVQEFLLNKERSILYGSLAVPWEIFAISQKHNEAERYQRERALFQNSWLDWLKSPRSLLGFTVSQWQATTNHIHREQTRFATQNGLSVPSMSTDSVPASSLPDSILTWIGNHAPKILAHVVAWRTDIIQPSLPSMAETLQRRIEESVGSQAPTRSAFSLFLQDLAEMQCFDRRDKIYGLTALLGDRHPFPIDYSIDVYELYFRALQFFLCSKDFSTEPCSLAPEYLACGLLDVLKIPLSDLAKNDPRKRSVNYAFVSRAQSNIDESEKAKVPPRDIDEARIPNYKDIHHVFQTFEDCLKRRVQKDQELRLSCSHCGTIATFHAATLLKLQLASNMLIDEAREGLVAVLQCLISDPVTVSNVPRNPYGLNDDDEVTFQHLLLFYESKSGRPDAVVNLEGQIRREGVLRGFTPEVLKTHLEYGEQALKKRSPTWTTFPY